MTIYLIYYRPKSIDEKREELNPAYPYLRAWSKSKKTAKAYLKIRKKKMFFIEEEEIDDCDLENFKELSDYTLGFTIDRQIGETDFGDRELGEFELMSGGKNKAVPMIMSKAEYKYLIGEYISDFMDDYGTCLDGFPPANVFKRKYLEALERLSISMQIVMVNYDQFDADWYDAIDTNYSYGLGPFGYSEGRHSYNEFAHFIDLFMDELKSQDGGNDEE